MDVQLGYMSIGVKDTTSWLTYAQEFLAVQSWYPDGTDGDLLLRIDDHAFRYILRPSGEDDVRELGWQVATSAELAGIKERLEARGFSTRTDDYDAKERLGAAESLVFEDPDGLRSVAYVGPSLPREPVELPRGHRGFVTGDQGTGHMVLAAGSLSKTVDFYEDVLGFRISDYIGRDPSIGGGGVVFMHCNPRHHTMAFFEGAPPQRLNHIMFQCNDFDDVGRGLDVVQEQGIEVVQQLGKHSNDWMTSFYAVTPSGFECEYGWGGRTIDDTTWTVVSYDHISTWGHQRSR